MRVFEQAFCTRLEKGRLVQLVRDTREMEHGSTWSIGLDEDTGMECWLVFTNSFLSINPTFES